MELKEAQFKIQRLLEAHQKEESVWTIRATYLLTVLLPILAWPEPSVLRGDAESLLQLDELIRRANIRSGALSNNAWQGVRAYLTWLPGLHMDPATRQIALSGTLPQQTVDEQHGYVLMELR